MAEHGQIHWCEPLYDAKAAELILYGRALGLGHGEAEDVLQETFVALAQMEYAPAKPTHYCVRSFRNRALNYRRSLWRRLAREWESLRWFEKTADETPATVLNKSWFFGVAPAHAITHLKSTKSEQGHSTTC